MMTDQKPTFGHRATLPTTTAAVDSSSSTPSISPSPSPPLLPSGPVPRLIDRGSFSSVKEDDCGIAQSFTDSKESTFHLPLDNVVADSGAPDSTTATTLAIQAPAFCCPCGQFRGWKEVHLKGRAFSRSYGDLKLLGGDGTQGWEWGKSPLKSTPPAVPRQPPAKKAEPKPYPPGKSPLENLPVEILGMFLLITGPAAS